MASQVASPIAAPAEPQPVVQNVVYEDPLEVQKKYMKQARELAIKRRQEAEAKEEAERKERIRIKLEAMGPLPESMKNKKEPPKETPKEEKAVPVQIQARDVNAASKSSGSEGASEPKVKAAEIVDKVNTPVSTQEKPMEKPSTQSYSQDSRVNDASENVPAAATQPSQDARSAQWQNNTAPAAGFKPWTAPSAQQSTSQNVWGSPTNNRTLGNGTFNPELSRLPDMQPAGRPGPIGPPNANHNSQYQQARGRDQYSARPAPIGPPNRQAGPVSAEDQARRAAVANSGWGSLPDKLARDDALASQKYEQEMAKQRELQAQGLASEPSRAVFKDTWRQVNINEDGTRSKVQANLTTTIGEVASAPKVQEEPTTAKPVEEPENARRPYFDGAAAQPPFNDAWRSSSTVTATAPPTRGSRFFPNHNRDVRLEDPNFGRPGSPQPPPPTMAGHPAYDGDSTHPLVALPPPQPVVKLPPPPVLAPIAPPKPISFAAAVAAPAVPAIYNNPNGARGSQDIRRQEPAANWQDRINNLIGRPKNHLPAVAVDSSSKSALEHTHLPVAATVSLPSSGTGDLATDDGSIESKPAAEECFEEQEMGSIPIIKVPHTAPSAAWQLAPPQPKSLPRKFQVTQATSAEQLQFPPTTTNDRGTGTIQIKVPGQEAKSVTITLRQKSNPRRGGGGRGGRGQHPRGGRGRDTSSGYPSPSLDNVSVSSSPNSTGRGGRGRGYGPGSNWNRHNPTPVHT